MKSILFLFVLIIGVSSTSFGQTIKKDEQFCKKPNFSENSGYNFRNQSCYYSSNDAALFTRIAFGNSTNFLFSDHKFDARRSIYQRTRSAAKFGSDCLGMQIWKKGFWDDGSEVDYKRDNYGIAGNAGTRLTINLTHPVVRYWSDCSNFKKEFLFKIVINPDCQYKINNESIGCYLSLKNGQCYQNRATTTTVKEITKNGLRGKPCPEFDRSEFCPKDHPSRYVNCDVYNDRNFKPKHLRRQTHIEKYGDAFSNLLGILYTCAAF